MSKKQQEVNQVEEERIELIEEALLENVAGGDGPGDCTNHGGCKSNQN